MAPGPGRSRRGPVLLLLGLLLHPPPCGGHDLAVASRTAGALPKSRRAVPLATGAPVLTSVTVPQQALVSGASASAFNIAVGVTSADQPNGYLNLTAPTGTVALRAPVVYSSAGATNWTGDASIPLNVYMPPGTYTITGVFVNNSAGQLAAPWADAFVVSPAALGPGTGYGAVGVCATGSVGLAAFVPLPGMNATSVSCCDPTLPCALGGAAAGQPFGTATLALAAPSVTLSNLTLVVTQALSFTGATTTLALQSNAQLILAGGATASQATGAAAGPLVVTGCGGGTAAFVIQGGASLAPAGALTLNVATTNGGTVTVAANTVALLSCAFTMATAQAAVVVGAGGQLISSGALACTAGAITGAGTLAVTGGTFQSTGCNITTSALTISPAAATTTTTTTSSAAKFRPTQTTVSTSVTFCGQWPSTTIASGATVTIPPCSAACPCTVSQLQPEVALVAGSLTQSAGATLQFNRSTGNLSDYGSLDVTGQLLSLGPIVVLLGMDVGTPTVSKDLLLLRYNTSAAGGCDPSLVGRTSWSNAPSGYNVTAVCQQAAGALPYTLLLRLSYTGPVAAYGRLSQNSSLAWALVGIALAALFGMCALILVKISRRPAVPKSGAFEDQDVTVAAVLQEADPFIPSLTPQPAAAVAK